MKYIVILILLIITTSAKAQLFETRQIIDMTLGASSLTMDEKNMFFPSSGGQSGINIHAGYGYKITSFLEAGFSFGYLIFTGSSDNKAFVQLVKSEGSIFSVGPQVVLHSPFSEMGIFNRFRIGLAFSPQYRYFSGERSLIIDNEVIQTNNNDNIQPVIEMAGNSSSIGVKLSPEINYRLTQRVGLKVAHNMEYYNIDTGYNSDKLLSHSFLAGMIFTFGNYKLLY